MEFNIPSANVGQNFMEMPKKHHHVSKLLVLIIVLIILALIGVGYTYFINSESEEISPSNTTSTKKVNKVSAEEQLNILKHLSASSTVKVMSKTLQMKTLSNLSKPSNNTATVLTDEQKLQILKTLHQ